MTPDPGSYIRYTVTNLRKKFGLTFLDPENNMKKA
jgi:hypothetical protein